MKHNLLTLALVIAFTTNVTAQTYTPTEANLAAREAFQDYRFGIFLHWGIYSTFAQGEWYLNNGSLNRDEYAKAANAFYPHAFDADQWVAAIRDAGARYITFTSRHHDGFSMWDTQESDYNIVRATPFRRDVIRELADACHRYDIALHLYYSHIDWTRDDYPWGRTGRNTGKDPAKADWPHYYRFMNNQLTELLTRYGKIGAIWFDGFWDRDEDATPFDWQLPEQYALIHQLQPSCLVGNNHHVEVHSGEDIQIFERDVPGQNTAGLSGQAIGQLPLETCQTMNGMWGYKVADQDYKTTGDLIRLLVNTAGMGANLLLNIGPQPDGQLPADALQRLREMGVWMRQYGASIYGTRQGILQPQPWGVTTRNGNTHYIHIIKTNSLDDTTLTLPINAKVLSVTDFVTGAALSYKKTCDAITITLPTIDPNTIDYVIIIQTK